MTQPKTVSDVLAAVYGEDNPATVLKVGPSSISNWRGWGYFPAHIALQILADAEARSVPLSVGDVPTKLNSAGVAA